MSNDTQFEIDGDLLEDFSSEAEEWGGEGAEEEDDDLGLDAEDLGSIEEEEEEEEEEAM